VQQTLDEQEARVVGSLIEKSLTTPDQYPITLNALTNACNQKSARHPVMAMSQGEVQHTIRALEEKHLVVTEENFKSRSEKYSQRFCGTRYSGHQFDAAQVAVVCLLLLRGPQTPGELKSHCARIYTFSDTAELLATLERLAQRAGGAAVMRLPTQPGHKESRYAHLFAGEVESLPASSAHAATISDEAARIAQLELEVGSLRRDLDGLRAQFDSFIKQF
jgi:uncharacterized protein YceH (UPF0502 family)